MKPELIIWNLDEGLVDVQESYRSAIRRSVQHYFTQFLGLRGGGSLLSDDDIAALRMGANLHEPVELTAVSIRYLLSLLPGQFHKNRPPRSPAEAISFLKKGSAPLSSVSTEWLRDRADFSSVARRAGGGGGLAALYSVIGGDEHPLFMAHGTLAEGNLVRRLFQEFYLGRQHFSRLEGSSPQFYRAPGMIEHVSLLANVNQLEQVKKKLRGRVALVSHQPLEQIQVTLQLLRADRVFEAIVGREDIISEEARRARLDQPERLTPPNPYLLLEAASRLDPDGTRPGLYIGGTPDDMRAARAAATERPLEGWGILAPSALRPEELAQQLRDAGADRILESVTALTSALQEL